jgi:uncharacterized membrane protein YbhN (UPF0104 family)
VKSGRLLHDRSRINILLVIISWCALMAYAWVIRENFSIFSSLTNAGLAAISLLLAVQLILQTIMLPVFLEPLGIRLKWSEWFPIAMLTGTANLFIPAQGATALRAVYMKRNYSLSYSQSVAMAGFQFVVRMLTLGAIALIGSVLFGLMSQSELLLEILAAIIILSVAVGFVLKSIPDWIPGRLGSRIESVCRAWDDLKRHPNTFLMGCLLNVLILLVSSYAFFNVFRLLGFTVPFEMVVTYTAIKLVTLAFPLIPGNIGVPEILTGAFAVTLNLPFEVGIVVALAMRALAMMISLVLSGISLIVLRAQS